MGFSCGGEGFWKRANQLGWDYSDKRGMVDYIISFRIVVTVGLYVRP